MASSLDVSRRFESVHSAPRSRVPRQRLSPPAWLVALPPPSVDPAHGGHRRQDTAGTRENAKQCEVTIAKGSSLGPVRREIRASAHVARSVRFALTRPGPRSPRCRSPGKASGVSSQQSRTGTELVATTREVFLDMRCGVDAFIADGNKGCGPVHMDGHEPRSSRWHPVDGLVSDVLNGMTLRLLACASAGSIAVNEPPAIPYTTGRAPSARRPNEFFPTTPPTPSNAASRPWSSIPSPPRQMKSWTRALTSPVADPRRC
jgi:hypothetical protein